MSDINGVERTYANKDHYDFEGGEYIETEILEAMQNKENTISTQKEQVLAYVRTNKTITHREAEDTYSITRIAAVIFDLKELGHKFVEPTKIIKGVNKFGTKCTWAEYEYLGRG
tara:strand:+ start:2685 stop:3026 length:342 start_codon:yes stop_codon:yes gene_type:complete